MKTRFILIIVLCFESLTLLNAQIEKGKLLLGVSTSTNPYLSYFSDYSVFSESILNAGFANIKFKSDSYNSDPAKISSFSLSPRIGYISLNNLALGLDVSISASSSKDFSFKSSTTTLGIGPFLRYYFPLKGIKPFIEVAGSIGSSKTSSSYLEDIKTVDKNNLSTFLLGIGLALPIGEKVSFDMMGGYISSAIKSKENNTDNSRIIINMIGIKLGLLLYL
jgi:hypothetical protein